MLLFQFQPERSKSCMIIADEIHVKAAVTYSGGVLFGYSEDVPPNEKKIATTILAVMVKCLFTDKRFLAKLVPCQSLKGDFLYNVISGVIENIEDAGGKVIAIITDNNRVNQALFKKLPLQILIYVGFEKTT